MPQDLKFSHKSLQGRILNTYASLLACWLQGERSQIGKINIVINFGQKTRLKRENFVTGLWGGAVGKIAELRLLWIQLWFAKF